MTSQRNKIVILPLGDFDASQQIILNHVVEYLALFFGLTVEVEDTFPLASLTLRVARRTHPEWGGHQLQSTHMINRFLRKRIPPHAATYLCLTTYDLWPGEDWNFVFGQASLVYRVGVWSMYRFGDPSRRRDFRRCLKRVLATAAHETAHQFGLHHCTAYSCGMCGSNSLEETDSRPLHFCPECTPKIAWATGVDLKERATKLQAFMERTGLVEEKVYYQQSAKLMQTARSNDTNQ